MDDQSPEHEEAGDQTDDSSSETTASEDRDHTPDPDLVGLVARDATVRASFKSLASAIQTHNQRVSEMVQQVNVSIVRSLPTLRVAAAVPDLSPHFTNLVMDVVLPASTVRNMQRSVALMVEQALADVDFSGIQEQAHRLTRQFIPKHLRESDLKVSEIREFVEAETIPLYSVPRAELAVRLIRSAPADRSAILEGAHLEIVADCRRVLDDCDLSSHESQAIEASLDALEHGVWIAAQSVATDLLDPTITAMRRIDPLLARGFPTNAGSFHELFGESAQGGVYVYLPLHRSHRRYYASKGDEVPTTFNRHATTHSGSGAQFTAANALISVMQVCALILYREDLQAAAA